jgi:hypothetical protein
MDMPKDEAGKIISLGGSGKLEQAINRMGLLGAKINRPKVEINIIREHGETYAEVKINNELIAFDSSGCFTAIDIYKILKKLDIPIDYSDKHRHVSPFKLFSKYKEYVENLAEREGKTVKEYLELNKNLRVYEMIEEVIDTEIREQYAYEQHLNIMSLHRVIDPYWYYTVTLDSSINEKRQKELYEVVSLQIKKELGLV